MFKQVLLKGAEFQLFHLQLVIDKAKQNNSKNKNKKSINYINPTFIHMYRTISK